MKFPFPRPRLLVVLWCVLAALPVGAQSLAEQPFSFRWKAVEGAGGYRVEIRQREGEALLTQAVDADQTNLAVNLVPGPYQLKVTTLNRLGQDESSTAWTPFHVAAPNAPALGYAPGRSVERGQTAVLDIPVEGLAQDGVVSLRSPSGKTVPATLTRIDGGLRVTAPALDEPGTWDLVVTNPPSKAAVAGALVKVPSPQPQVEPTETLRLVQGDPPLPVVIRGKDFRPGTQVTLEPAVNRPLPVEKRQASSVTVAVPPGLPPGTYHLWIANGPDQVPVEAGTWTVAPPAAAPPPPAVLPTPVVDPAEAREQIKTLVAKGRPALIPGLDKNSSAIWDLSANLGPEDRRQLFVDLKQDGIPASLGNIVGFILPLGSEFQGDWKTFVWSGGLRLVGVAGFVAGAIRMNTVPGGGGNGSGVLVLLGAGLFLSGWAVSVPLPFFYAADYNRRLEEALRLDGVQP